MKANKLFAIALAALTLVGFNACKPDPEPKPDEEPTLALDQTSLQLEAGATATITATVEATWTSNAEAVATVAGDGKTAVVTAVAEGNAIITATTAGGQTKTCVVLVSKKGGEDPGNKTIDAKRIWPVVLDAVTAEKNASIIAGDFRVNDVDNHLYIWASGETYTGTDALGLNYFGNSEGYIALIVAAPAGWSGLGFCIENAAAITAMQTLKAAIVADPDKYFLHIGIKATTPGNHQFYTFGTDATSFNIGTAAIEKGAVIGDFERDGAWHGFDIPLSTYVNAIAAADVKAGINIFCVLSGNAAGSQLNLDAVYFYEK